MRIIKILCILFWTFIICLLLGCSKKELSTSIKDSIKSDITVIEGQLSDFVYDLPTECKTPSMDAKIKIIQDNIKTLYSKLDNQDNACKLRIDVIKEEKAKLEVIIVFLLVLCFGLGYWIIKRK